MNLMMPNGQPTGGYNFPQAPAGVMTIPPALSGGYYNQMAQMMAGPNYQMPHFKFTGLDASGLGGGNGVGMWNFMNGDASPVINQSTGPTSGIGTGMGPYAFGGSGSGDIGGMGSYAPLVGGGGSFANPSFPASMTLGGGNVTGGYSPNNSFGKLIGSMIGGTVAGLPGAIAGGLFGNSLGSGNGGLLMPNGTILPTQNMNLPPTSIPMPTQNIKLAQPIINPVTGMPYGTAYGETPQGARNLQTEQNFANQALGYGDQALMQAFREATGRNSERTI